MKVLFSGSREWLSLEPIKSILARLPRDTVVIHGAARGVDNIAGDLARQLGMVVREYPALAKGRKWPSAGPLRNRDMLASEHPYVDGTFIDQAFFIHQDPGLGKGTKDMYELVLAADPAILYEKFIGRGK